MASWIKNMRSGFNRQNEPAPNGGMLPQRGNGSSPSSPTGGYPAGMAPLAQSLSPSATAGPGAETGSSASEKAVKSDSKFFFQPRYAKLGVRGNFMPLAAKPANVDLADWLAHQTVENYRVVATIAQVIQEVDSRTGRAICNPDMCPKMAAGLHSYTWLDNNKQPVEVSAPQYIGLVQRWMNGKIHDPKAFPTEPTTLSAASYASGSITSSSEKPIAAGPSTADAPLLKLAGRDWVGKGAGFPETFLHDVRTCFRQIFRIYAHLYHSHWVDPFWHLSGSSSGGYTDLNSCFVHFCTVAKLYGLLSEKDAVPMQPLLDIWVSNGSIPADAAKSACAVNV